VLLALHQLTEGEEFHVGILRGVLAADRRAAPALLVYWHMARREKAPLTAPAHRPPESYTQQHGTAGYEPLA